MKMANFSTIQFFSFIPMLAIAIFFFISCIIMLVAGNLLLALCIASLSPIALLLEKPSLDAIRRRTRYISQLNGIEVRASAGELRVGGMTVPLINAQPSFTITTNPVIIVTNAAVEQLSKEELSALIAHERGHVELDHVMLFYLLTPFILYLAIGVGSLTEVLVRAQLGALSAVSSLFIIILSGMIGARTFYRVLEREADWYAIKSAPDGAYSLLKKLSSGDLPRWFRILKRLFGYHDLERNKSYSNPESTSNFAKSTLLPLFLLSLLLSVLIFKAAVEYGFHPLSALSLLLVTLPSYLAAFIIFSSIIYKIFRFLGFPFYRIRASVIAYWGVSTLPLAFSLKNIIILVTYNLLGVALSSLVMSRKLGMKEKAYSLLGWALIWGITVLAITLSEFLLVI